MPLLTIFEHTIDVECVVFDKDGTLIDFDHIWSSRIRKAVDNLLVVMQKGVKLRSDIFRSVGVSLQNGTIFDLSPMSIGTAAQIEIIVATVLYQHGFDWQLAQQVVADEFLPVLNALPTREELKPLGDLPYVFSKLQAAGIQIAIATMDDRVGTEASLQLLGIRQYVDMLVCGDDPLPSKPDIAVLQSITDQLGVGFDKMMMVGDSVNDLLMARSASLAFTLGISGAMGNEELLLQFADAIAPTIDVIQIRNNN